MKKSQVILIPLKSTDGNLHPLTQRVQVTFSEGGILTQLDLFALRFKCPHCNDTHLSLLVERPGFDGTLLFDGNMGADGLPEEEIVLKTALDVVSLGPIIEMLTIIFMTIPWNDLELINTTESDQLRVNKESVSGLLNRAMLAYNHTNIN